ncbi:MAG: sugar ABC transporter permease [Dorea sp.]|nr:sugar ABC transporter permease [Dorea sp.]
MNRGDVMKKTKMGKRQRKEELVGYLFIMPVVIGLSVFYIFPFLQNIWFGFNDVNQFNVASFCGADNYVRLLEDKEFLTALANSLKSALVIVPAVVALSLLVASLLNTKIRGKSIYRTLYFLPAVTMSVAISLVWKWIYNGEYGVLNSVLKVFGIEGINWLSDPKYALIMVLIVEIWMSVGYNMIILLAGMQGISTSYYEAAVIDGAGPAACFFKITIPILTPTIFFVVITSIISSFQIFDTIFMMIPKDSPAFSASQTLVMMFYRNAFDYGAKGYAAAISSIVFLIVMLVTAVQFGMQKKWVHYE